MRLFEPGALPQFLRFAAIAGAGWLLDAVILLTLVATAGMRPGWANVFSSCTAALSVFMVSRQTLFSRAPRWLLARVAAYLAYTLCLIFLASLGVELLVWLLAPWIGDGPFGPPAIVSTAIAKVLVTPPQLLCNFLVARHLSERRVSGAS